MESQSFRTQTIVMVYHRQLSNIHLPYRLRWDRKGKESFIVQVRFHTKLSGGEGIPGGDSTEL